MVAGTVPITIRVRVMIYKHGNCYTAGTVTPYCYTAVIVTPWKDQVWSHHRRIQLWS